MAANYHVVYFTDIETQILYLKLLLQRKYMVEEQKIPRNDPVVMEYTNAIRSMIENDSLEKGWCMDYTVEERYWELERLEKQLEGE